MSTIDKSPRSSTTSRREFLRLTGQTVAVSALASLAIPRCHAAENSTIKLALVGCGGRGTGAVDNALVTKGGPIKLHAMADLFEDRLQSSFKALKDKFPDQVDVPPERQFLGFDAYKKAIDCLGPDDVVLLTTHAAFRPMYLEYAVGKGVNVFAEKSFATDGPAVRRWLKAAERRGAEEPQGERGSHVAALASTAGGHQPHSRRRDWRRPHLTDLSSPRTGPVSAAAQGAERSDVPVADSQ